MLLFKSKYDIESLSKETLKSLTNQAAFNIEQTAKQIGLLPENGRVEASFLGSGMYGNAFNVSFLDENDEKVINDKVIKLFVDDETKEKADEIYLDNLVEYYKNLDFEEFWQKQTECSMKDGLEKQISIMNLDREKDKKLIENMKKELERSFEITKSICEDQIEKMKTLSRDELKKNFAKLK